MPDPIRNHAFHELKRQLLLRESGAMHPGNTPIVTTVAEAAAELLSRTKLSEHEIRQVLHALVESST